MAVTTVFIAENIPTGRDASHCEHVGCSEVWTARQIDSDFKAPKADINLDLSLTINERRLLCEGRRYVND